MYFISWQNQRILFLALPHSLLPLLHAPLVNWFWKRLLHSFLNVFITVWMYHAQVAEELYNQFFNIRYSFIMNLKLRLDFFCNLNWNIFMWNLANFVYISITACAEMVIIPRLKFGGKVVTFPVCNSKTIQNSPTLQDVFSISYNILIYQTLQC